MATKKQALESALHAYKKSPSKQLAIYRVGGAWMFTSQSLDQTQALYKIKIKDWQPIDRRSIRELIRIHT